VRLGAQLLVMATLWLFRVPCEANPEVRLPPGRRMSRSRLHGTVRLSSCPTSSFRRLGCPDFEIDLPGPAGSGLRASSGTTLTPVQRGSGLPRGVDYAIEL